MAHLLVPGGRGGAKCGRAAHGDRYGWNAADVPIAEAILEFLASVPE